MLVSKVVRGRKTVILPALSCAILGACRYGYEVRAERDLAMDAGLSLSGPGPQANGGASPSLGGNPGRGGGMPNFGGTGGMPASGGTGGMPASGGTGGMPASGGDGGMPASGGDGGMPASGGSGGMPASGGSGGIPASGGSGGIPASGGSGGMPASGGSGGMPASGGSGGMPASGGSGGMPASGGSGGMPASGGSGGTPASGGTGGMPASGGSGGTPASGGTGGMPASGGSGGIPASGGSGGMPASGGTGGMPASGGSGGTPASGGAPPVDPEALCAQIPFLAQTPILDGELDDGLVLGTVTPLGWHSPEMHPIPSDVGTKFAVGWRPDGLYFYVEVTDSNRNPTTDPDSPWLGGGAEIYVDHDGAFDRAPPNFDDPGTVQFTMTAPPDDSTPPTSAARRLGPSLHGVWAPEGWVCSPTPTGFVLEAFVRAADLGLATWTLTSGSQVAFDVSHSVAYPDGQTGEFQNRMGQYFFHILDPPQGDKNDYPFNNQNAFCTATLF